MFMLYSVGLGLWESTSPRSSTILDSASIILYVQCRIFAGSGDSTLLSRVLFLRFLGYLRQLAARAAR